MLKQRMPSLFIGHGSPMNLMLENDFTKALDILGKELPLPKAILVISAHWYAHQTAVSMASGIGYETLYDFYGFPPSLYEIRYESPSNNTLSKRIAALLDASLIERGLDHGAWMPLHFLFPKASVPVIQLSIDRHLSFDAYVAMGKKLALLREEGIMLLGSGNITHNLGLIDFYNIDATPASWAKNVDAFIENAFTHNDIKSLVNIEAKSPDFKTAHPSFDHYAPLLYIAGTRIREDHLRIITPLFQHANLSMKGFMLS